MLKIKLTTLLLFVYSFSNAQILSYYINDGSSINQFITNDLNKKYLGTSVKIIGCIKSPRFIIIRNKLYKAKKCLYYDQYNWLIETNTKPYVKYKIESRDGLVYLYNNYRNKYPVIFSLYKQ